LEVRGGLNEAVKQLAEQVIGVPREEQERLAQEARSYYLAPKSKMCDATKLSEFDKQMLSLFDSIEANGYDIDGKIEGLRLTLKKEGGWTHFKDQTKVGVLWTMMAGKLQVRDRALGETSGMWQLRCNWNRISLITNRWTTGITVAPGWLGPEPIAREMKEQEVGEMKPYDPSDPPLWFKD
jgi:hypothetical protein